jgi:hypothetical protein
MNTAEQFERINSKYLLFTTERYISHKPILTLQGQQESCVFANLNHPKQCESINNMLSNLPFTPDQL